MNNNFEYLTKEVKKEAAQDIERTADYIAKYENTLRNESTETRWNQYKAGTITKEQAIEYATKRATKRIEKKLAAKLAHLEAVAQAPELNYIRVTVEFTRGGRCNAEIWSDTGYHTGTAGGWGYDKESAAVGEAFNKDLAILKVIYTLKENALREGKTDTSATACTGRDNRDIIGYGAGYTALPYFEGGVGVNCFWNILRKAGYETTANYGKHEYFYNIRTA